MADLKSKILLCKDIELDKSYTNVLSYTEEQMLSLCNNSSHLVAIASDYSFIRTNGTIFTSFTYSQCLQANYIAFQNKDYSNKWFFAFIDDVIYAGEKNTEIKYTIDSWSTWYDYWTKKACYVLREHVNDDTIGLHTLSENLDVGDVVCEVETEETSLNEDIWIAIESAWQPTDNQSSGGEQYSGITLYNNQLFGNKIFLFQINTATDYTNIELFILRTNGDGHVADIKNLFAVPRCCNKSSDTHSTYFYTWWSYMYILYNPIYRYS